MVGVPQAGDDVVEVESIAVAMGDTGLGVDTQAVVAIEVLDGAAVRSAVTTAAMMERVAVGPDRKEIALVVESQAPTALVDESMVMPTELHQVGHRMGATVGPVLDVVDIDERTGATARESTTLVT